MILPTDNFILLSQLCEEEDVSAEEIIFRLSAMGYVYNEAYNTFKAE